MKTLLAVNAAVIGECRTRYTLVLIVHHVETTGILFVIYHNALFANLPPLKRGRLATNAVFTLTGALRRSNNKRRTLVLIKQSRRAAMPYFVIEKAERVHEE